MRRRYFLPQFCIFVPLHTLIREMKKQNGTQNMMMKPVLLNRLIFYYLHFVSDSNTQSSDVYTLSTNSGSENSKASSSDTSPALRNSGNQSRLSTSSRPTSERNSSANTKCVSEGSVSPLGHSSYSATTAADVCADNQTVINLGNLCVIFLSWPTINPSKIHTNTPMCHV